jgi:CubicO group peptidase (beta-lactamase class C family)
MNRILRRALAVVGALAALLVLLLLYIWMKAGWDAGYMWRVLWHQDSGTSDYRWKRAARVAPAATPAAWPTADGCAGVAAAFAQEPEASAQDMDAYLSRGGALALVVVKDGAVVCEWYGNGGARAQPAAAFSITKTVTSLLLARAIADGKIGGLDDAITMHVPALARRDPRFGAITLAHLVDMRSGLAFDEDAGFPWVDADAPAVYYASDLARTTIARPRIEAAPGPFRYNDYAPNLLGLALEHAYGARLAAGPMQALWNDLGAEHAALWSVDGLGFAWHESGLVVTARDLARVGQLVLEDGRVADRQVAPPAFIARSLDPAGRERVVTFAGTELGYRNGWWVLGDRALVAMGRHGQVMLVSPATRTVIVRLGLDGHAEPNISIARRFERIASRLSSHPASR